MDTTTAQTNLEALKTFWIKQRKEAEKADPDKPRSPQVLISTCVIIESRHKFYTFGRIDDMTYSSDPTNGLTVMVKGMDTVNEPLEIGGSNVSGFTWRWFKRY